MQWDCGDLEWSSLFIGFMETSGNGGSDRLRSRMDRSGQQASPEASVTTDYTGTRDVLGVQQALFSHDQHLRSWTHQPHSPSGGGILSACSLGKCEATEGIMWLVQSQPAIYGRGPHLICEKGLNPEPEDRVPSAGPAVAHGLQKNPEPHVSSCSNRNTQCGPMSWTPPAAPGWLCWPSPVGDPGRTWRDSWADSRGVDVQPLVLIFSKSRTRPPYWVLYLLTQLRPELPTRPTCTHDLERKLPTEQTQPLSHSVSNKIIVKDSKLSVEWSTQQSHSDELDPL